MFLHEGGTVICPAQFRRSLQRCHQTSAAGIGNADRFNSRTRDWREHRHCGLSTERRLPHTDSYFLPEPVFQMRSQVYKWRLRA